MAELCMEVRFTQLWIIAIFELQGRCTRSDEFEVCWHYLIIAFPEIYCYVCQ